MNPGSDRGGLSDRALYGALTLLIFSAPFSIAISQLALTLAWVPGIALWMRGRRPARTGLELPILAFMLWILLMIPFSGDPAASLRHAKRFLLLPSLWLFAGAALDEKRKARLMGALALGAAGVAVYGLINYFRGPGGLAGRAMLTQGYMTAGGLMMLTGLALTAFLLTARGWRLRAVLALALLPVLAALLFTYTRSAWFGYAAGSLFILALSRPRLAPFFAAALIIAGLVAPGELRLRLVSSFDPRHPNNAPRVTMWQTGWRMLQDHPLTGVGDRSLKKVYLSYHKGERVEVKDHLHSNYVMFAAIWGWPGFFLALFWLFSLLAVLLQRWQRLAGQGAGRAPPFARGWVLAALGAWLGFMVAGLFEWNFGDAEITLMLYSLTGIGLAAVPAVPAVPEEAPNEAP